jgi:hypothetical protein
MAPFTRDRLVEIRMNILRQDAISGKTKSFGRNSITSHISHKPAFLKVGWLRLVGRGPKRYPRYLDLAGL